MLEEHLVLLAQTLGLNTCWVGLSYSKVPGTYVLGEGEKIASIRRLVPSYMASRLVRERPIGTSTSTKSMRYITSSREGTSLTALVCMHLS